MMSNKGQHMIEIGINESLVPFEFRIVLDQFPEMSSYLFLSFRKILLQCRVEDGL